MKFFRWLSVLLLTLVPMSARAISLQWASGSTQLSFTEPTRCVLVVKADSTDGALPDEWRLLWLADSSGVNFVAEGSSIACSSDTARVSTVTPPSTAADSAANMLTTQFCSASSATASTAYFVLDQPGGSCARFKVVALDPRDPDTMSVIESNEVTCNAGVDGQYFPAILRVRSYHRTTTLRLEAVGSALSGLTSVSVSAPELGGEVPLSPSTRTDVSLIASADIAVPLPACQVRFVTPEREFSVGQVPADRVLRTPLPYRWVFKDPDSTFVYPKDFAFINAPLPINGQWQNLYHLYYIRNYWDGGARKRNGFALGHAWSRDLEHWNSNRFAFVADTLHPTRWDGAEVWAPCIVQFGGMFHLFYTGLDSAGRDQTIGYATAAFLDTTDLPGHWTRRTTATLTPTAANWVNPNHPWQFRDPFVIVEPDDPTRCLLFYTATQANSSRYAVGLFRSASGNLDLWENLGFYERTTFANNGVEQLESPHVFPDVAHHEPWQSAAATWRLMYTEGAWTEALWRRAVWFHDKVIGAPLTDTRAVSWADTTSLARYLGFSTLSPEYGVQATEILHIGGTYYWGGYNGGELVFRKLRWYGSDSTDFALEDVDFLAVELRDLQEQARLRLAELRLGQGRVRFRIELPASMRAEVAIYDVMGRLIQRVVDKQLMVGATEVTWDGHDRDGAAVGSGIYFARLRAGQASRVVRVPLVR